MRKAHALHLFWNGFGIKAIDEVSSYDKRVMEQLGIDYPYISYQVLSSNLGDAKQLTASIWYRSTSWDDAEAKAEEIASFIGIGGRMLPVDGGYLRIMLPRNAVIYQRLSDPNDSLRRIIFYISVDFLTAT